MKFFVKACALLTALPALALSLTVPNADTPVFYLVSSSTVSSVNLLPLRMSTTGYGTLTLTGTGTPAKFYFYQGQLTAYYPNEYSYIYRPLINTFQIDAGTCAKSGAFVLAQGGSTNKCASYSSFQIQSNNQNSQLGAQLVFNYVGGFYACGSNNEVYYKYNSADLPTGCTPIGLWTVPVA